MTTPAPKATVALIVHNEGPYLRPALDSLTHLRGVDYEIVICDDASTDGSSEICQAYARRDARIRYHRNSRNGGAVQTFNQALGLARGQYFLWAMGHDLWDPDFLRTCARFLDANPKVALCYTQTRLLDQEGRPFALLPGRVESRQASPYPRIRSLLWSMASGWSMDPIEGLFRREVVARCGGFRNQWGTDNLLLFHVALLGQVAHVPKPLYSRRMQRAPSQNLRAHVQQYFARLDPSNRERRLRPTYARLLMSYLEALRSSGMPAAQRLGLGAHAVASLLTWYPFEIVLHDFLFGTIRLVFGQRVGDWLEAPFDWVARKTKYANHPAFRWAPGPN